MKAFFFLLLFAQAAALPAQELLSPDGRVRVRISSDKVLKFDVVYDDNTLLESSEIDILLQNGLQLSSNLKIKKRTRRQVNEMIVSPVPEKRRNIPDRYNSLEITFRNGFGVEFRAYDDGVAYRLLSHQRDSITVVDEKAVFRFSSSCRVYYTAVVPRNNADKYHTSFEEPYSYKPIDSIDRNTLIFSPTLVMLPGSLRMVITESDLEDYPGMFLQGNENNTLSAHFAPAPLEEKILEGEFPAAVVTKRQDFIARTAGTRSFPWRVLMLAREDRRLPENDLVYRLASPSRVKDVSWIKPGKGTDEWITGINLFNVPFKSGINTATYKYYIDFAKRFGFERIMMDAGWSDASDLFKINPAVNMDEIAAYAREKEIGLSMWTLALALDRQLEPALQQFKKWGVDFIMTDFMDRDDQKMVNFYHRIAEACARYQIMIMYHGAFKTAGFNRTWPHAVTREGVLGSEYNIWSEKATPEHNLLLPFIRMTAGAMDYEPGLLNNASRDIFRPVNGNVMSLGTRCHQAAMFVVYESPIQLFSGNPSQGLLEPAFMELIGSIPTVWDTTQVLQGKIGDYIVTARRKGYDWYLGAMTDWTARDLTIPLHFLSPGKYKITLCSDGVNADRYASDYVLEKRTVDQGYTLSLKLAAGGGALARIRALSP